MELKCVFKVLNWQGNRKLYSCIVKEASIVEKETEIAEINGKHFSLSTNNEVQGIKFKNPAVIEFFPRGLCKIFPRLKGIDITDCGLKELTRDDLVGLKNLELLFIQSNQLSSLPDDLFTGMKELKKISFWDNKLHLTSSRLLQPIRDNELNFVDFGKNENIRSFFDKTGQPGSTSSIGELMTIIDEESNRETSDCSISLFEKTLEESIWVEELDEENLDEENQIFAAEQMITVEPTDFTIITGDSQRFFFNRKVLAAQSSVFAGMHKKGIAVLKMEDIAGAAIKNLMSFMYSFEIPGNIDVFQLLEVAVKLNVAVLARMCEKKILAMLDENNAVDIFAIGHRYKLENLKARAFYEIKKMFSDNDTTMIKVELMITPEDLKKIVEIEQERKHTVGDAEKKAQEEKDAVMMKYQKQKSKKKVSFEPPTTE